MKKIKLSDKDSEKFTERFPTTDNETLAKEFGVSVRTVSNMAKDLGLKKSPEYIHEQRKKGSTTTNAKRWKK